MGAEEADWLSAQAVTSAKWLKSLPEELLSPTGRSLLGSASELERNPVEYSLADVSLRRPSSSNKPPSTQGKKPAERSVQPPLMMDVDSPDR